MCLDAFERLPRRTWLLEFPCQVVLTVQRLLWTRLVQQAILREQVNDTKGVPEGESPDPIHGAAKALKGQLTQLVMMINDQERKLTALQRTLVDLLLARVALAVAAAR